MSGQVLHDSLLALLLEYGYFLNIDIAQGSVETCSRWCGIFKDNFITNLLLTVKHF